MAKGQNEARFTADISDFEKKLSQMTNDLTKFAKGGTQDIGSLGSAIGRMSGSGTSSMMSLVGSVGKLAGAFGLAFNAVQLLGDNISTAMNFEKSVSGLKALTGLGSNDMEYLKNAAIELGGSSTQTASQVAEAFKLIGSQKPELLKSKEALKDTTSAAITLAEAAGMEVPDAAKALTGVLNQFDMSASKSKDVINMLAAASQQGAGDIVYLNDAITKCGSVASSMGVPVEEVIANVEQLAQSGIDASSAGTALRNVMLALVKTGDSQLNPSTVGLTNALTTLRSRGLSDIQMMQMFGKENIAAAQTLLKSADAANSMKSSIVGTNTAFEQAKTNSDNLDGSMKALSSAWEAFNLHINDSNGLLKGCVDWFVEVVKWADQLINREARVAAVMKKLQGGGEQSRTERDIARIEGGENADDVIAEYMQDIADAESKIRDLRYDIASAIRDGAGQAVPAMNAEIDALKEKIDALRQMKESVLSGINKAEAGGDTSNPTTPVIPTDGGARKLTVMEEIQFSLMASTDKNYDQIMEMLESCQQIIDENPLELSIDDPYETEDIEDMPKKLSKMNSGLEESRMIVSELSGAFSTLGNAIGGVEGSMISLIGTMAQQVMQGVVTISNLKAQSLAAKEDATSQTLDAGAKAMNAHSWIPFVGVAMGVGMVATLVATLMSMPKFEHGGIVGGNSYTGDKILARLNSGEGVLTRNGMSNLESAFGDGNQRGGGTSSILLRAEDIIISLNAYGRRNGLGNVKFG